MDAVEERKSVYPDDILFYLVTLQNWQGVTGVTTMDPYGDVATRFPRIFKVGDACDFVDVEKIISESR